MVFEHLVGYKKGEKVGYRFVSNVKFIKSLYKGSREGETILTPNSE